MYIWLAGASGLALLLLGTRQHSKVMIALGVILLFGLVLGRLLQGVATRYDLSIDFRRRI